MENLNEYTLEELNEFLETEEYQQLDEISKKLLGSYIKNASLDSANNAAIAGLTMGKNGGGSKGEEKAQPFGKKADKRYINIKKAVDKLVKESTELDSLFFQIDSGELADAKQTVTEILSNKVSDVLSTMKQQLSKTFVNESSCNVKNGDEEVDAAVENLPKPKKAKPEVDGDGNVVEKWKPVKEDLDEAIVSTQKHLDSLKAKALEKSKDGVAVHINKDEKGVHSLSDFYDSKKTVASYSHGKLKEDLDEAIVHSKNKAVGDKIDSIYKKAAENTKTVNLKDLFKKK